MRLKAKDGPAFGTVPEVVARRLQQEQAAWLERLRLDLESFGEVEQAVPHRWPDATPWRSRMPNTVALAASREGGEMSARGD